MFYYETHCHTSPVSRCARAGVEETLLFYRDAGYDGVFITNHFLDGNIALPENTPYQEGLDFYFSDYRKGLDFGKKMGLKVFFGVEHSYKGTDFLVYNLPESWYRAHPEIIGMKTSAMLSLMTASGALVVQAHPFREASYIDHVRLFPHCVQSAEVYNALQKDFFNSRAEEYVAAYGLIPFAGSDNHKAGGSPFYGGMASETPVIDEADFTRRVLEGKMQFFRRAREEMPFGR
ncbi:MAG: PHP domain-containing protein [Victivallaceae bacterium]|nr:PHP domain-containing protein [Victivallaceae bacterium]